MTAPVRVGRAADVSSALDAAAGALVGAEEVTLVCHEWPDGDALGSLLGLLHLCREHGKRVVSAWPAPADVAPHYAFLPGLDLVDGPDAVADEPELMVTFDCGSPDRLGRLRAAAAGARQLVVLDHHASASSFGSINVIDPEAAATAVIVRRLATRLGWPLTRDAAACLYVGLVTDTGRFQYSNTSPAVFSLAEELAGFDLPIAAMSRELFEKNRFAYLKLTAACLARATFDEGLGLVATWVTQADLDEFGVAMSETEGLIDLVRRTAEARVAVVAKESPEGVRVSLRSLDDVDVGGVATSLGGGGHRYAAGFIHQGTVGEALAAVRAALDAQP